MVKKIVLIIFLFLSPLISSENIYEQNCVSCHKEFSVGLDKLFLSYLKKYSDEVSVKLALIDFLQNPNRETTAMSEEYIRRLGIKSKTDLNETFLMEAVDIYWQKYNVFDKLN